MVKPVLDIVNGVPMLIWPSGISGEVDPNDPRFKDAICQLKRQKALEEASRPAMTTDQSLNH
jgi:hypothetical protein